MSYPGALSSQHTVIVNVRVFDMALQQLQQSIAKLSPHLYMCVHSSLLGSCANILKGGAAPLLTS